MPVRKLPVLLVPVVLLLALSGCSSNSPATSNVVQAASCTYAPAGEPAKAVDPPSGTDVPTKGEVAVTLKMTEGDVTITMDRSVAPCTVNSFVTLADQGFFTDTSCHRLTTTGIFVLQCGDPTGTGTGGPGYAFADELTGNEKYTTGTVAMANAGPDTNGSQFFLVWDDSTVLPPDYTVFGKLDEDSLAVVQYIAAQGASPEDGMTPMTPAKIESVVMG